MTSPSRSALLVCGLAGVFCLAISGALSPLGQAQDPRGAPEPKRERDVSEPRRESVIEPTPAQSLDVLLQRLEKVKAQQADLARQEQALVAAINDKVAEQQRTLDEVKAKLRRLGILREDAPSGFAPPVVPPQGPGAGQSLPPPVGPTSPVPGQSLPPVGPATGSPSAPRSSVN